MVLRIILLLIAIYLFLDFILARFIIPFLGFKEPKVPKKIPKEIMQEINKLKKKSKTKKEYAKNMHKLLSKKHQGGHINTIFKINRCFITDLYKIWHEKGFLPCTIHSYLVYVFILKSGMFKKKDVRRKRTIVFFNIHEYMQINIDNKWVDVDVWGVKFGVPFGKHAWFFT